MWLEITEGSSYRRARKTESSEYCGARDNIGFEIPWGRKTECLEYCGARDNRGYEIP